MNTRASVALAAEVDPSRAQYQAWLAERLENEGQDSSAALEAASRLDPFDSRVWIRRGLNAELSGKVAEAEGFLLRAAAIDKLMEPRWTLMNFYFRRGEKADFWHWAKEAFAMSYGDRRPLLELCWRMNADVSQISKDPEVSKQYFLFLITKGGLNEAADLASRVTIEDRAGLNDLVERLLQVGQTERAVQVWNEMCERRLIPFQSLDLEQGRWISNPEFAVFPTSAGFDWRPIPDPAIAFIRTTNPNGLRVTLSGKQGDRCRLLSQIVPVKPGTNYRLRFSYRTSGASGINAYIANQVGPDVVSEEWKDQSIVFNSGENTMVTLSFEYRRPSGQVRMEGSLWLRGFRLELAE